MWNDSSAAFGGGFLDESVNGTQGGSGKKGPRSSDKSIVPLMIKHITSPSTGDLQVAGKSVNTLTIIGIVRNIEQETTKISYTIQDDTDTITAVMWLEADKGPMEDIQINTYVRVHGLIREQSNKRHLLILRIRPVEDLNELSCHIMEVLYFILNIKEESKVDEYSTFNTNAMMSDNMMSGMSAEQMTVLEIVRSANDAECGIEKQDIMQRVPKHIVSHLNDILDFLLCEGHIYTTSSEDFFKAT